MIRVRIRFSVWLVSCYAHVFVRLWVLIVTDRQQPTPRINPTHGQLYSAKWNGDIYPFENNH